MILKRRCPVLNVVLAGLGPEEKHVLSLLTEWSLDMKINPNKILAVTLSTIIIHVVNQKMGLMWLDLCKWLQGKDLLALEGVLIKYKGRERINYWIETIKIQELICWGFLIYGCA